MAAEPVTAVLETVSVSDFIALLFMCLVIIALLLFIVKR